MEAIRKEAMRRYLEGKKKEVAAKLQALAKVRVLGANKEGGRGQAEGTGEGEPPRCFIKRALDHIGGFQI